MKKLTSIFLCSVLMAGCDRQTESAPKQKTSSGAPNAKQSGGHPAQGPSSNRAEAAMVTEDPYEQYTPAERQFISRVWEHWMGPEKLSFEARLQMVEDLARKESKDPAEVAVKMAFIVGEGKGAYRPFQHYPFAKVILHYGDKSVAPMEAACREANTAAHLFTLERVLDALGRLDLARHHLRKALTRVPESERPHLLSRVEYLDRLAKEREVTKAALAPQGPD